MLIVKVGGGDLELEAIAEDLASIGRPFVLLHGANKLRDRMADALGTPPRVVESVSGYTSVLTDDDAMDAMLAAYAGIRNKRLVEALRGEGLNAIGLTGLDGGLVLGEQNRGIRVRQDGRKLLLRDQSGKPREVNARLLHTLLAEGYVPVLTAPIGGRDGAALNSENDDVLSLLARALGATEIVSLIEAPGLLADADDPGSLVREVDASELSQWEERVSGRMRRKIRAVRALFEDPPEPAPTFRLSDGRVRAPVTAALAGAGTVIRVSGADLDRTAHGDGAVAEAAARGRHEGDAVAAAGEPAAGAAAKPTGSAGPHPPAAASVARAAGGSSSSWLERNATHELDVYGKRGIVIVSASGARVTDETGRSYVDCIGGNGSLALGHRHPVLQQAVAEQLDAVWCAPGAFVTPARTRFLERLHDALPATLSRTFLSNSGTEAVEAALKIARVHTGRSVVVGAKRGFHGRTMGALAVTADAKYREPFEPLPGDVRRIRFNDADALREAVDGDVGAVVLEPVQGEGGVHPAEPAFLVAAREACDAAGALLVLDEVQTGFGRTGRIFAFEHSGVVPDVVCLAKSIAGGLPLGATVVRDGVDLAVGLHGSTFGGNPLACAAGRATLDLLLDTDLLESAERIGARICAPVLDDPPRVVREVRRVGAMIGIQLRVPARPLVQALTREGVLALTAGRTVLRFLPPLVMTVEEADEVGSALYRVLSSA